VLSYAFRSSSILYKKSLAILRNAYPVCGTDRYIMGICSRYRENRLSRANKTLKFRRITCKFRDTTLQSRETWSTTTLHDQPWHYSPIWREFLHVFAVSMVLRGFGGSAKFTQEEFLRSFSLGSCVDKTTSNKLECTIKCEACGTLYGEREACGTRLPSCVLTRRRTARSKICWEDACTWVWKKQFAQRTRNISNH
jgi:hypothetical protein